jgi:hypothetical protein
VTTQTCFLCGAPATLEQVGRCVYASPCGHRYQGRIEACVPAVAEIVRAVTHLRPHYVAVLDSETGLKRIVRQVVRS